MRARSSAASKHPGSAGGGKGAPHAANARALEQVPQPLWKELPRKECMDADGVPILQNILLHFLREGRLSKDDASQIVKRAHLLLDKEPNTLMIEEPVTIVGDINGQVYDLAKVFTLGGSLGDAKYLFLGNYLGSCRFSCECFLFLLAAKVVFPEHIFLLRGNHESRFMAHALGVDRECALKYSESVYNDLLTAFNALPLAALISETYLCVHGGLSPDISRVGDIQYIHRHREVPSKGAMCDLLWSDPHYDVENPSTSQSNSVNDYYVPVSSAFDLEPAFFPNEHRGCGYLFNFACVKHFENVNKLRCIIRSHEVQDAGYKLYRPHPNTNYPSMICVFSAPNYCDTFDNRGAILRIAKDNINFTQFFCSPHPFALPNMNGVTWSLPFLTDTLERAFRRVLGHPELDTVGNGALPSPDEDDESLLQQRSGAR